MSRPAYKKADRAPTWTSLVLAAVRSRDDFMTLGQICEATAASHNQASAALHHLKVNARAVDCLDSDGQLWWYASGDDARSRSVEVRVPVPAGNRTRKRSPGYKARKKPAE